jgi:hypothetical protein
MLLATAASAVPIDSVGDTFTVAFDGNVEARPVPGLTASATFLVSEFDSAAGRVVLEISLANTADPSIWKSALVAAICFDVDAPLVSASASGLFSHTVLGKMLLSPFGALDVCATDDGRGCSGERKASFHSRGRGGDGHRGGRQRGGHEGGKHSGGHWKDGHESGVEVGQSGVLTMTLQLEGPIASLDLSSFGVRYEDLTSRSLKLCDASGTGRGTVPEPRALALLGAAGLALWGRKRRA